jgi:SAM-dependent methyltransferase
MDRLHAELAFHDQQAHARRQAWACSPSETLRFAPAWYLDHESWIRPAFELLGNVQGKRILDYGCGHGMAGVVLAAQGAKITAFDLSGGYVHEAVARAAVNVPTGYFQAVQAVGERLPFADGVFDRIWGHAILHHLELHMAAAELRRVLQPEGWAVFCEPWGGNPLIEWVRRYLPYPGKERTVDERPLQPADVAILQRHFRRVEFFPQQLLGGVRRIWRGMPCLTALDQMDRRLFQHWPALRKFCRYTVLLLQP